MLEYAFFLRQHWKTLHWLCFFRTLQSKSLLGSAAWACFEATERSKAVLAQTCLYSTASENLAPTIEVTLFLHVPLEVIAQACSAAMAHEMIARTCFEAI